MTEAKLYVASDPRGASCDLPAGPSELLVVADRSASPVFVAADLLSQAEHGIDSQVVLVSPSRELLLRVEQELEAQLALLPRASIARQALQHSLRILVADLPEALEVANRYAPEHLILQVEDPGRWADEVRQAGSVFLGPWSPESVGDYASGTNHVLPTYGFARSFSGVSADSFFKYITFQRLTADALRGIGPVVETLASLEGLEGHRQAVSQRLQALQGKPEQAQW